MIESSSGVKDISQFFLQVYDFFASDVIGQNFLLITASQVEKMWGKNAIAKKVLTTCPLEPIGHDSKLPTLSPNSL